MGITKIMILVLVNECEHNNGGCEHGCLDTHSSFQCFCDVGYELDTDGRGCIGRFTQLI